jgi:hypothetical protein
MKPGAPGSPFSWADLGSLLLLAVACLLLTVGPAVLAQDAGASANVAGNWTIQSVGSDGEKATQTLQLTQNGDQLTGRFKGPRQSGTVSGTVTGKQVDFTTKTRAPIHFRCTVDGDSMQGTLEARGKSGTFTATRSAGK